MKRRSISYELIRILHLNIYYRAFHRKIKLVGKENLPDKPTIIVINHQNTLMDPMALITTLKVQICWLARADIFKKKFIARLLTWIRILPVYRQVDGSENLKKNDITFAKSSEIIKNKIPLALFPEATHWGKRKLRATKKAVPRIAFLTEEKNNFNLDIHILPIGLYFDNYFNFGRDCFINIGKPITIGKYKELYFENQVKAYNELKNEIEASLRSVMIDIQPDEFYDTFEDIRLIYRKESLKALALKSRNLENEFKADQRTVNALNNCFSNNLEQIQKIDSITKEYTSLLKKFNIKDWLCENKSTSALNISGSFIVLLLGLPFFLYGFIFNAAQFYYPSKIIKKKLKDKMFTRAFNFVVGFFIFPITHVLFTTVFALTISTSFWQDAVFLFSLPITGLIAFYYRRFFVRFLARIRYLRISTADKKNILELRQKLIHEVSTIF